MRHGKLNPNRLLAVLVCMAVAAASAAGFTSRASADENIRRVRVGYYQLNNYQEYDSAANEYRGYSYDYMLAVAQYAGWEYEFVPLDSYDEGLKLLESGDIDLLNNVVKTSALESSLYFSSLPSGESYTCLLVKPDNTSTAYEDYQAFDGLTVGLDYTNAFNSGFVDYCKDNDCMPKLIYYRSADEVQNALDSGEIDACIGSSLKDSDMRVVAKFDTRSGYFATTRGNSDLLGELNRAMNSLKTNDPYFEEKLFAKYHARSAGQETVLTSGESDFIASNPVVRVSYDPSWYPVSYRDGDGNFKGAMADLFSLISSKTGLSFQYVPADSAEDAMKAFSSGQTDVMAGFPYDYTWAKINNAELTPPFMTLSIFSAYKSGTDGGGAVAQPAGSYQQYYCEKILRDGSSFQNLGSADACLRAVLNGQAGSTLLDSYQLEYYSKKAAYRDLSFKAASFSDYRVCIATSNSASPYISSIINKTLTSLGSENISSVFRETALSSSSQSLLDVIYTNPRTAGWFFSISGFLLAAMISVIVYTQTSRKKNRKLSAAINAKSEFMSNISHDMRTPLNGVIGYTNLALRAGDPAEVRDYLHKVRASSTLMLDLINDTLDVSKIESGKYVLSPENTDVGDLISGVTIPIQSMADEKNIKFIADIDSSCRGTVFLDKVNTQKILMNLLSNAIKFTPDGGTVRLSIENIPVQSDGCNCKITVSDTGIGIGEDFMPKLFEPFMQEQAPEAPKALGTGLGLSIVKSMVELMRGHIEVESKKGSGTRFEVYLPVVHVADDAAAPESAPEASVSLRGKKVLLCEDNEMNTEIATLILGEDGVEVVAAPNGKAGVELFAASAAGEFSAVLMDLRMPVMNGYEAAKAIRELDRPDAASVPIIAMSADTYPEDIKKCIAAGMNGQVSKPVDKAKLMGELSRLCGEGEADKK
jgi:two-component system sensor histidine kinase EvgS